MISAAVLCLAITVYHEARGEPVEGQKAVIAVAKNRAKKNNSNVCKEVRKKSQFEGFKPNSRITDSKSFHKIIELVQSTKDTFSGATYFHKVGENPSWKRKLKVVGRIGNHIFYRER